MEERRGATRPSRVLIVDDDDGICLLLESVLALPVYETTSVGTAADALSIARSKEFDAVLLDRFLPETDAVQIVAALRSALPSAAIVMLSAVDDVKGRVDGLRAGADDFLTKPFHVSEVIARIEAVHRRALLSTIDADLLSYADIEMDVAGRRVWRNGTALSLTPTEFRLLEFLVENAERVLSRGQLLERVWGYDFGGGEVVEKAVSLLRKKVDAGREPLIQTVRGFGYCLRSEST
ncbi:response regulator transcription factor [Herbiconiux moechotypicola]|uniref:Response regulator transcription factor n=2 Tax=Herbiconiux moechotypicola TaxID=637393 RepID=A0ABN3DFM1_9MICO